MSVETPGPEAIELPDTGDAGFAALMDALVDAEDTATVVAGESTPAPAVPGTGQPAPASEGTPTAGVDTPAPAAGDAGEPSVPDRQGVDPTWTADATEIMPAFGELSTALETRAAEAAQRSALAEAEVEYAKYFEALQMHPRMLIGKEVPSIGKEGMETLRDSDDAREWQEAVKGILLTEVKDRAIRKAEESGPELQLIHSSIELFQNNTDLIPGTKQFDRALADRFVELAKPYEHNEDGNFYGYTIPVQPIIDKLREQLKTERASSPAASSAPAPKAPAGGAPPAPVAADPPQVGIPSKAGNSSEQEDFSTLFGTIGLPNFRI